MTHTASDMHDDSESTAPLKPAPCPFCGSVDKPTLFDFDGEPYVPGFEIRCDASGWEGMDGKGCGATSGWGETPAEALEAWNRRAPLAASPAPQQQGAYRIEHDGFEGTPIGSYVTREGKRGVVLQQVGTKVVHVYGEKWLSALSIQEPAVGIAISRLSEEFIARRHPPAPAVPADELVEQLKHERQLLAEAIAEAAKAAGIYNGEAPLTGPHLLLLAADTGQAVASLTARAAEVEKEHAAARTNFHTMQQAADTLRQRATRAEAALARALDELKHLMAAYVGTLEIGRDRIMGLGGTCDPVDVMEAGDPALRRAKAFLAATLQSQRPE